MRGRALEVRRPFLFYLSELKLSTRRYRLPPFKPGGRAARTFSTMSTQTDYSTWHTNKLIARITDLEARLRAQASAYTSSKSTWNSDASVRRTNSSTTTLKKPKAPKPFDPSKYTTRLIALKFAYIGAGYNGFEHHLGNSTPLPTIEEELWKALVKCRLIFPPSLAKSGLMEGNVGEKLDKMAENPGSLPVDWEGCEYSKCGRTDKGVSAFGQVVSLRVRSAKLARTKIKVDDGASLEIGLQEAETIGELEDIRIVGVSNEEQEWEEEEQSFHPVHDELPYISLLNRVLPATIRVLAWCPSPPTNFSARFSCKERVYKYFFTNPAFLPFPDLLPTSSQSEQHPTSSTDSKSLSRREGFLDIYAMRTAASYLIGTHDFRNFCKVDPTKQLTNFKRRITQASIETVSTSSTPVSFIQPSQSDPHLTQPTTYSLTVRGSAFLWHQVRCMVGMLFLVGQGLERPEIVSEMLDVSKNPRRPQYEMASDKPLVLWDCTFSTSAQERYMEANGFSVDDDDEREAVRGFWDRGLGSDELQWVYADGENKWGRMGLMEDLWRSWRSAKMDEVLASHLLDLVVSQGVASEMSASRADPDRSTRVFQGEDSANPVGRYVPVMQKERMEPVEVINAKYLARKDGRSKNVQAGAGEDAKE